MTTDETVTGTAEVRAVTGPSAGPHSQLVILAIGFVMATLDATVVNLAGSQIGTSLHLSLAGVTWVVDGYILTFASLLLLAGTLAQKLGAKTAYQVGLTVFVVGSAASAASPSGGVLIAARLVQGAGAAIFMPSSLALLARAFPDARERGRAMGLWAAIVSTASGLGPFVGGTLVEFVGWRSIFLINLPIGIIGFVLAAHRLPPSERGGARIAPAGHVLGLAALAGLAGVLIEGPSSGWASPVVLAAAVVAVVAGVGFVLNQFRSARPVIPRDLFRAGDFTGASIIGFLLNTALFGGLYMLGLYLQRGRHSDPWQAGLQLLPMMIVFVIGNLAFARIARRLGSHGPLAVALTVAAIGSVLLSVTAAQDPLWVIIVVMAVVNLAVGLTVPAMTAVLMGSVGPAHAAMAGAALNATRQIGALVGIAATGAFLEEAGSWTTGVTLGFCLMLVAYTLAGVIAWRIRARQQTPASR